MVGLCCLTHILSTFLFDQSLNAIDLPFAFLLLEGSVVMGLLLVLLGDGLVTYRIVMTVDVEIDLSVYAVSFPLLFHLERLELNVLYLWLLLDKDRQADYPKHYS